MDPRDYGWGRGPRPIPKTDDELWVRVQDLDPPEFERVTALYHERLGRHFEAAVDAIKELHATPLRIEKGRGRPPSKFAPTKYELEVRTQALRRLLDLVFEAVSALPAREPLPEGVVLRGVKAGIDFFILPQSGPMAKKMGFQLNDDVRKKMVSAIPDAVRTVNQGHERTHASRVLTIVHSVAESLGWSVDRDYLQDRLKRTKAPQAHPR